MGQQCTVLVLRWLRTEVADSKTGSNSHILRAARDRVAASHKGMLMPAGQLTESSLFVQQHCSDLDEFQLLTFPSDFRKKTNTKQSWKFADLYVNTQEWENKSLIPVAEDEWNAKVQGMQTCVNQNIQQLTCKYTFSDTTLRIILLKGIKNSF